MGKRSPAKGDNSEKKCFICGGASFSPVYKGIKSEGGLYDIKFCANCGLGRTEPFLNDAELQKIYSSSYREDDSTRFASPLEKAIALLRVQRCRRVEGLAKKGRILDVGCGRADFLLLMKERGWETSGLELDKRIEGRGKKTGMDLRFGTLDTVKFPDSHFDAVTFWHVFEHIRRPEAALAECRRVLKPGGVLVIAVPNIDSVQAKMSGKNWFHLDPPFHLYHYSAKNLTMLLDKSGFEAATVRHYSFEYNPYGFLQSIFNMPGFKRNLFYDFLRSRNIKGLSSKISIALMLLAMPVALPLSMLLSLTEAALRLGGTIEVYARKRA
ncbi:MAG: class I SAM-dependent methyltransferase [Deltaproteobacteria bacterium]|nr:class I SAM-dependent methyltransferase [Deltaproteobacteria bacterium]